MFISVNGVNRGMEHESDSNLLHKEVSVKLIPDSRGFMDRQCTSVTCHCIFKVRPSEWDNDDKLRCPLCGNIASFSDCNTADQIDQIRDNALAFLYDDVDGMLKDTFASSSSSSIKISCKLSPRPAVKPIVQSDAWDEEHLCPSCGCVLSTKTTPVLCPRCGRFFENDTN